MSVPVIYFDLGNTLVHGPSGNKQPFGDALATIEELWLRGYRIGVLSDQPVGMTEESMRQKLDDYGLESYRFDLITISSEFSPPIYKPDEDIFNAAVAKAGFAVADNNTVFITENIDHINDARQLGWRAIHNPHNESCSVQSGECIEDLDDLLALFPPLHTDIWIRDNQNDPGGDHYQGSNFFNSPDLWIRNQDDGALIHQSPEAGQDNWFYARVRNRGVGIARISFVTFAAKEWAGTQFVFPADYSPYISLVGAMNIDPGESQIVRAKWPQDKVPAAGKHVCWLTAVYHSGDLITPDAHVWEHNNLAQKNLIIVNLVSGESAEIDVVLGSRHIKDESYYRIELFRGPKTIPFAVSLIGQTPGALEKLVRSGQDFVRPIKADNQLKQIGLRFLESTRVELTGIETKAEDVILELEAGSSLSLGNIPEKIKPLDLHKSIHKACAHIENEKTHGSTIVFDQEQDSGIGIALRAGQIVRTILRFTVPKNVKPGEKIEFNLLQRGENGQVLGGIAVQINIQKPKTKTMKSVRKVKKRSSEIE
ncbi:MAG: HAD hydrolase-like protein [Methyloprofundus sp.]|nr:HAD hydrolase-like protein [Methyloprofundus sp.]